MNRFAIYGAIFLSTLAQAGVPDVTITTLMASGGYATLAGKLVSQPEMPVGISVQNGNISYSTVTDAEGRWGIVVRHQSTKVNVSSWNLTNPTDRSTQSEVEIPN